MKGPGTEAEHAGPVHDADPDYVHIGPGADTRFLMQPYVLTALSIDSHVPNSLLQSCMHRLTDCHIESAEPSKGPLYDLGADDSVASKWRPHEEPGYYLKLVANSRIDDLSTSALQQRARNILLPHRQQRARRAPPVQGAGSDAVAAGDAFSATAEGAPVAAAATSSLLQPLDAAGTNLSRPGGLPWQQAQPPHATSRAGQKKSCARTEGRTKGSRGDQTGGAKEGQLRKAKEGRSRSAKEGAKEGTREDPGAKAKERKRAPARAARADPETTAAGARGLLAKMKKKAKQCTFTSGTGRRCAGVASRVWKCCSGPRGEIMQTCAIHAMACTACKKECCPSCSTTPADSAVLCRTCNETAKA